MAVKSLSKQILPAQSISTTPKQTTQSIQKGSLRDRFPSISKQDDPIGSATVTASALNVRKGPGTNYERVGGLTKGKVVQVYEDTGDWLKIMYGTEFGYIAQQYTDFKDKPTVTDPDPGTQPDPGPGTQPDPNLPPSVDGNAPAGATYTGTETLKKGASNKEAVKTLQLYLNKCLASSGVSEMSVDSDFGNTTWKYLMYYQYSRNLCDSSGRIEVDGICGPKTWNALRTGAPVVYDIREPIAFSKGYKLEENCATKLSCGGAMCPKAAARFEELLAAAKAEAGITMTSSSSFRGMTDMGTTKAIGSNKSGQIELFVHWNGDTTYCAKPGYSNHQSGKAIDLNVTTAIANWMAKNSLRFDFKRYEAEDWHWDYIGK